MDASRGEKKGSNKRRDLARDDAWPVNTRCENHVIPKTYSKLLQLYLHVATDFEQC